MKKITLLLVTFILFVYGSHAQIALTSGLAVSYPFTGNANDASGNGLNGIVNGASLTSDRFGNPNQAYFFNGSSSYINTGNILNSVFAGVGNKFTISVWVKPFATMSNNMILAKASDGACGSDQRQIYFRIWNGKAMLTYCSSLTTGNYVHASGSINITDTSHWYHIIVKYDGSVPTSTGLDRVNIYVDNALDILFQGAATTGVIGNIPVGTAALGIGNLLNPSGTTCGSFYFHGKIDDIRIYDRLLNTAEINALYTGPTTVGVTEESKNIGLDLFPNPASGKISFSMKNISGDVILNVYDLLGKNIYQKQLQRDELIGNIDISDKPKGIYFVQVKTEKGNLTKKIVTID